MKLFVWDLHGVQEKGTEHAVLDVSNAVLEQRGYSERFTEEDIDKLFGVKWHEYFEYLLPNESHETHLSLQQGCVEFQQKNEERVARFIKPNDYVHEVLEAIAEKHRQIVLSITNPKSIGFFVDILGIGPYFPKGTIFGVNAHLEPEKTKKGVLEEFLKDKEFDEVVVISDSPSDAELASVAGGKFYLYSHPERPVKECPVGHRINDLREILKEI